MNRSFLVVTIPIVLLTALTVAAQPPEVDAAPEVFEVPTVMVSGQGEVRVEPDEATVELGVTAQAETAGTAQDEANRVAGRILEAVRELGVDEKAVQTSRLNLYPVYADREPRRQPQGETEEPRIVGYRASNVVSVRLSDLGLIGPVIDAAVKAGANQVQGVSFQLRDDAAARREALKQAVGSARGKAEAIAEALGRQLGPVLQVQEGSVSMELPRYRASSGMMRMEMDQAPTPVAAGDVAVSASVQVAWRLLP